MIVAEDFCLGCPPELCFADCQYRGEKLIRVCDRCKAWESALYIYKDYELCENCVVDLIKHDYQKECENDSDFIIEYMDSLNTINADDVPSLSDYYDED